MERRVSSLCEGSGVHGMYQALVLLLSWSPSAWASFRFSEPKSILSGAQGIMPTNNQIADELRAVGVPMDILTCLRNSQVIHDAESSHQMSQSLKRISSEHDMQLDRADDAVQDCRTCSKISTVRYFCSLVH